MAPKNKSNKKGANDDWEAEALGETPEATAAATATAPASAPAPDAEDDAPAAGGLMALMKKNREKRNKKKGLAADADDDAATTTEADVAAKAPEEANLDDEFALPEKKVKGGWKQPQAKSAGGAGGADEGGDEVDASGKVLTKAAKEKLKKEREKQRKKEQAKKKPTGPAAAKAEPVKAAEKETSTPEPAAPTTGTTTTKKVPKALAELRRKQEELRAREAAEAQRIADEEARIAAAEKADEEEIKRKEEEKARKKQKEKDKIERLKQEGNFKSKAEKQADAKNKLRLQQMREAGLVVVPVVGADADDSSAAAAAPKKSEKKVAPIKKVNKKAEEEKALAEAAERTRQQAEATARETAERERLAKEKAEAEAAAKAGNGAESELEDWDAEASDEDLKDDWDADSDEEAEKKSAAKKQADDEKSAQALASRPKQAAQDEESSSEEESSDDEEARTVELQRKREAAARREKAHQAALKAQSKDNLRSPICCILGHVDTGKTKLLDKIRQTNVQEGEAGGITQQIGATYFPVEAIKQKVAVINKDGSFDFKVPGLLVIDTPGHESFSNLRSRGSSLCNIAILVVDIMHGLEPQTLESMRLLRDRKTPFVVALNKIDRLYGWKKLDNNGFQDSLSKQKSDVQLEFKNRLEQTKVAFSEQGFNAELFYENKSMAKYVSLIPTSAHTGEGIPDMLKLIVQLTQERMVGALMYLSEVQATVLEVKAIEGQGMTIDVILSNGILREGDKILVCGTEGIIKTRIKALLTPELLKELRLKSQYVHNKEVKAALGVKISAPGLEKAIAGSRLLVVGPDDDEDDLEEELSKDLEQLFARVEKSGRGVSVQASTLGSLEALLDFLKSEKIPVANIGIGPVSKRDVFQCSSMLEKSPDYAVMLCFDVKIEKEAEQYAQDNKIKVFTADIIYHLKDQFTTHMKELLEKKKEAAKMLAVFPCVLKPVAVFNKTGPIVVGVDVVDGNLRMNTPLAAVKTNAAGVKEIVNIGRVTSIEREHKQIAICKKGQPSVAIKIEMGGHQPTYGRHLEEEDALYSVLSRASIDTLKEFYRDEVTTDEWLLIKKMKPLFEIP